MATYDGKNLRGGIRNLAFRKLGDANVVQSKPGRGRVKQTTETKRTASLFGLASSAAKDLRSALYPTVRDWYDGAMIARLTSAMRSALEMLGNQTEPILVANALSLLEFNNNSPFCQVVHLYPEATLTNDIITLKFPATEAATAIKKAITWHQCTLRVSTLLLNLDDGAITDIIDRETTIAANQGLIPAASWTANTGQCKNGILIALISAELYEANTRAPLLLNSKQLNPVSICGAWLLKQSETNEVAGAKRYKMRSYLETRAKSREREEREK